MPDFSKITPDIIEGVAKGDAILLDVRRDDEWQAGHAVGAVHFPVERMKAGELPDIPKDKPVYVHCAAGVRAQAAAELLMANGWQNVFNVCGLKDWQEAGGPVQ